MTQGMWRESQDRDATRTNRNRRFATRIHNPHIGAFGLVVFQRTDRNNASNMIRGLLEWKHSALLTGLLITGVIEPLSADWSEHTRLLGGLIVFGVNLGLLLIVFDQRWERWLAFVLLPPILVSNIVHETLSNWAEVAVIVYHCFTLVFVGFAVAVILKHIFSQQEHPHRCRDRRALRLPAGGRYLGQCLCAALSASARLLSRCGRDRRAAR